MERTHISGLLHIDPHTMTAVPSVSDPKTSTRRGASASLRWLPRSRPRGRCLRPFHERAAAGEGVRGGASRSRRRWRGICSRRMKERADPMLAVDPPPREWRSSLSQYDNRVHTQYRVTKLRWLLLNGAVRLGGGRGDAERSTVKPVKAQQSQCGDICLNPRLLQRCEHDVRTYRQGSTTAPSRS